MTKAGTIIRSEMIRLCLLLVMAAALAGAQQATQSIQPGQPPQHGQPALLQLSIPAHQEYLTLNPAGLGILITGAQGKLGPFASMGARVFLNQELLNFSDIRAWQSSRSRQESYCLLVDNARELVALRVVATQVRKRQESHHAE